MSRIFVESGGHMAGIFKIYYICIVPIFYNQLIEIIFVVICSEKQPVYVLAQDTNVKKIIHGNLALQGKTKYT